MHVELDGHDHRIYFEEAGTGIPLLMQHTAGSHGVQWRHLFEDERITDHFRLIAYDLPFHGKSVPPTGKAWWTRASTASPGATPWPWPSSWRARSNSTARCSWAARSAACSPSTWRATTRMCSAPSSRSSRPLKVDVDIDTLQGFWHPQVSNEYKSRLMNGLMAPQSPEPLRRETVWAYSSGWPPAFLGDLHYYLVDHDLTDEAAAIDTGRVGVHLLTGEYDASATIEHGQAAHEAIAGSTFTAMDGVGHFPMSENPDAFIPLPAARARRHPQEPRHDAGDAQPAPGAIGPARRRGCSTPPPS